MTTVEECKQQFIEAFRAELDELKDSISCEDGQWTIKGFIDVYRNVYTLSSDTKILSKILEIHLFPIIFKFEERIGYKIVLADEQNYYPDLTFQKIDDDTIKFAVDLKTTYRTGKKKDKVGFTLGSHGKYFHDRTRKKNIQFPYEQYKGHFCLGIVYSVTDDGDGVDADTSELSIINAKELGEPTKKDVVNRTIVRKDTLKSITSVISDFDFFFAEKWKISSDSQGSGNTANIGSISNINDIKNEKGVFYRLGESYFDRYWLNYNSATVLVDGKPKKVTNIWDFLDSIGESEKKSLVGNGAKKQPKKKDA